MHGVVISIIVVGPTADPPSTGAFGACDWSIGVGVIVGGTDGRCG